MKIYGPKSLLFKILRKHYTLHEDRDKFRIYRGSFIAIKKLKKKNCRYIKTHTFYVKRFFRKSFRLRNNSSKRGTAI